MATLVPIDDWRHVAKWAHDAADDIASSAGSRVYLFTVNGKGVGAVGVCPVTYTDDTGCRQQSPDIVILDVGNDEPLAHIKREHPAILHGASRKGRALWAGRLHLAAEAHYRAANGGKGWGGDYHPRWQVWEG